MLVSNHLNFQVYCRPYPSRAFTAVPSRSGVPALPHLTRRAGGAAARAAAVEGRSRLGGKRRAHQHTLQQHHTLEFAWGLPLALVHENNIPVVRGDCCFH